mmetsp:Transcript_9604/g.19788  ORF Transcript_9604/g.19788 Transcript_9604/m.19788 type:complete len:430 (-) Transcript_9604:392-1681(-)
MSMRGWAEIPTGGVEAARDVLHKHGFASQLPATAASAPPQARLALPAKAIRSRLMAATELPSWAAYLPERFPKVHAPPRGAGQLPVDPARMACGASSSGTQTTLLHCPGSSPMLLNTQTGKSQPAKSGIGGGAWAGTNPSTCSDGQETSADSAAREQCLEPQDCSPASVIGNVWTFARDPQGCRRVQKALDIAGSDEARSAIATELQGHVWEAMRCPHANHVLQKCIVAMRPQAAQFIIDELLSTASGTGGISQAAKHRYGCRIVERLVEHCPPSQVSELVEKLVADAVALSRHPYGNYVMQHLLEHGQASQRRKLIDLLRQNPSVAASDCYARAVISKALNHGAREDQVALSRAVLQEPGLLTTMARTRHGHVAAKFVLLHLDGPDQDEARRQLIADLEVIRASRYGRFVVACLDATDAPAASCIRTS